jgi:hypothetical protein
MTVGLETDDTGAVGTRNETGLSILEIIEVGCVDVITWIVSGNSLINGVFTTLINPIKIRAIIIAIAIQIFEFLDFGSFILPLL